MRLAGDTTQVTEEASSQPKLRVDTPTLLDCFFVFGIGLAVFSTLISLLQNVHLETTNGLWKSEPVGKWVVLAPDRSLDPSNLLYFPGHGFVIRTFLPESLGPVWKRMAYLNAFYGAMALACTHFLIAALTRSRLLAWGGSLFQMGCGFFLLLSIINEDIMASYAWLAAALALAVATWDRPSWLRIASVGILFTISWLFEWRVLFPTLPALTLACMMLPGRWTQRLKWAGVFLGSIFLTVACTALIARGQPGMPASFSSCFRAIVWTGKGIGSGWGGFRSEKFEFLQVGVAQSLLGGHNCLSLKLDLDQSLQVSVSLAVICLLAVAFVVQIWRNRMHARYRVAFASLGGTLFCGQVMNLYTQPQDPQMQINVMAWLASGWALFGSLVLGFEPLRSRYRAVAFISVSLLPLVYNVNQFWPHRGLDTQRFQELIRIQEKFDLKDTVFVSQGFDGYTTWRFIEWKQPQTFPPQLDLPPRREGSLAVPLYLITDAIHNPNHTPQEHAKHITDHIDRALELNYRVAIDRIWDFDEAKLAESFSTVCGPQKPQAIHAALHTRYQATLVYDDPTLGPQYELRRVDASEKIIDASDEKRERDESNGSVNTFYESSGGSHDDERA
jgi:hypothetical protein